MKKNGKKNIVINAKSEKFFLNGIVRTRYNRINEKNKAYMPYQLFKKRIVFRNTHIPPYVKGGIQFALMGWGSA